MATGTREVVDYSYSRIDHAYARSRGIVGAMRYLYRNGKGLTPAEVALFRASGLKLGLNYEAGAGDFIGRSAGVEHAQSADGLARKLGLGGNVIAFSADWDVQSWQFRAVGDAVAGALSVLGAGKVGVYGHARLLAYLYGRFGRALIYFWQTYAWSGGFVSPYADLYQFLNGQNFAGGQVDFNDIRGRTFWAIGGNGPTTSGGNANPIQSEEDEVSATVDKIMGAVADVASDVAGVKARLEDVWFRVTAALPGPENGRGSYFVIDAAGDYRQVEKLDKPQGSVRFRDVANGNLYADAQLNRALDLGDGNTLGKRLAAIEAHLGITS